MSKIYRKTDRLKLKIDNIEVTISPLSLHEKTEIQQMMIEAKARGNIGSLTGSIVKAMKYSIKGISGLIDSDGNKYQLDFDENKNVSDESIDDLMNIELGEKLQMVCSSLLGGIPKSFVDDKGQPLAGVEWANEDKTTDPKN